MANSIYGILETRTVLHADRTDIYIQISHPTDFLPVGGWYKKTIAAPDGKAYAEDGLVALDRALRSQEFLGLQSAGWTREAPDAHNQYLEDELRMLREALDRTQQELVRRHLDGTDIAIREAANRALEEGIEAGLSLQADRVARLRGASILLKRDQHGRVVTVDMVDPAGTAVAQLWSDETEAG